MDPTTGLPDRHELTASVAEMLAGKERPALFAVSVDGYGSLSDEGPAEAASALREVADRLHRLVRSNDVLGVLSPGVFALAGPGVERTDEAVLRERLRGVFALPVAVGDTVVSLPVTVGVAHHCAGVSAEGLVAEAEADLERRLAGE